MQTSRHIGLHERADIAGLITGMQLSRQTYRHTPSDQYRVYQQEKAVIVVARTYRTADYGGKQRQPRSA